MAKGVKTIDKDKFYDAFTKFCNGQINIGEAAEIISISKPTVVKYFNMALLGQKFPDTLFERKKK